MIVGVLYIPNSEPLAYIDIFSNNLEKIMDIIQNKNKYGLIMGDINKGLLKFEVHRRTDDYLNNLFSHGFLPVISKPTRVTNISATLIDHIYANDITSSFHSDVADHHGTFWIFHDKTKKIKPKQIKKRIFNKANTNIFYRKVRTPTSVRS